MFTILIRGYAHTVKGRAPLVAQMVKNLPAVQENQVQSLGREDPLEKGMATHSSILAWRIHGQRSLAGYSPLDLKELDMTERLIYIIYTMFQALFKMLKIHELL